MLPTGDCPEPDLLRHGPQDREQPLPGLHLHILPGARHQGAVLIARCFGSIIIDS